MSRLPALALLLLLPFLSGCGYVIAAVAGALGSAAQGSKGGGVVVVQTAEGVDLVLGRGPKDLGDTTEGRGEAVVSAQLRLGVTSDATLAALKVSGRGTGDDGRIASVKLFHDLDGDGALGSGEPQLGSTQTFSGDEGTATFSGLGFALQSGVAVDLLVVSALPSDASDGETFRVELSDDQAVEATTLVNGQPVRIRVFGAPISGGVRTISSTGTLTVSLGSQSPSASGVFPNAQDVEVLQLELRASSVEDMRLDSLRLQASGTLNEALALGTIELFQDVDSDGVLNRATDAPLASLSGAATDDAALLFAGLGRTLAKSSIQRLLLVYQLNGSASDGQTFRADLLSAQDLSALGLSSNQAPNLAGPPIQGGATLTVQRARLELSAGPFNPSREATPGQSGVALLQLRLAASGAEPVVVSSLGIRGSGSGDEVADLAGVRLYLDQDGDGQVDLGEPLLAGPVSFPSDDGQVNLGGFSRELQPGTSELWLVSYDLGASATGGDQFVAASAAPSTVAVAGRQSGLVLTPVAPVISGGTLTVRGSLSLGLGPNQPALPNQVLANASDAPALQLVVGAGAGESVRLTGLTLTPSGTGNDQLALSGVDLYEDADQSGTVSAGDTLIQAQTYPGDDQALTFNAAGGLLAGDVAPLTTRTLLIRYRLNGQALQGQTFALSLPTTALAATGVSSGRPIPVSGAGLSSSGNPIQTRRAQVTFSLGAENPNAGDILNGSANVAVLQLGASAGPGEALNLSALTFRSSGTASETAVVQQARLYREGSGPRGVLDGTDVLLGSGQTYSGDDGFVTFSGAPLTSVAASTSATFLLAYDLLPSAPAGGTFVARLAAAGDISGAGAASGLSPEVQGVPQLGQQKSVQRGSLAASLGAQNPPVANTFPSRSGVRVLQVALSAGGAEAVRVSSLRLSAAGSADESTAISGLSLYLDLNQDGLVSAGDTMIASAASIPDDGSVVLSGFNLDVPAGQVRSLLATCDLSAAAPAGQTLRFRVASPALDLVALGLTSSQAITPSGAALEGNALSLVLGALSASKPASSPAASTELNSGQSVTMLQLRCAANATESARVSALVITHQGTGVPASHVSSASLYHDVNGNGVLDADTLLSTTTFSGTSATFTIPPGSFDVAQSASRDLLVVYDFNGSAPVGATFSARLAANGDLTALGNSSSLALPVSGAPLTGATKTLELASLSVALGAATPAAGSALRNQAALVGLQATLSAGSAEAVRLSSLRVSASGTLDLAGEVSRIRLYRENDPPNGVLDGDALIGDHSGGFSGGAHTFALATSALEIPAGGSKGVLVVLDLAAGAGSAGETVTLSLAANGDLVAAGVTSGQPVAPGGAPVSGNPQAVVEASLALALGPLTPAASDVAVVSSGVPVLQLRLGAGTAEALRVTSLRFVVSGAPTTGVSLARLYRDDNNNGVLDGDALLGSAGLGAGGDVTFSPAAGSLDVAPVGSRDVLLVFDFGNTASEGQSFTASLPSNGDLVAQGLTSTLAVNPSGAPVTGSAFTTRQAGLTVQAGTAPAPQTVFNNASQVSALHLAFQAGPADGVRVTGLTLRASGSADDTGLQVSLYRDTNGNGTLEGGEPLLQTRTLTSDEGGASFSLGAGALEAAAGQTVYALARVTLPGTASAGQTHALRLQAAADVSAQAASSGAAALVGGTYPVQGPLLTAQSSSLSLSAPTPQTSSESVFPNASELPMLRLRLDAGALEGVRVTQLVLRPTGASSGNDAAASVSLYRDVNNNGTLEVGTDALIQTQSGDDTSVSFSAGGGLVDVPAGGSRELLVVYTLGVPTPPVGVAYQVALAPGDLTAQGLSSSAGISAGGATQTGGLKTISAGALALSAGANNPGAGTALAGQTRVMQQLRLSASGEAIRIDSLEVHHTGSGDPASDLTQVLLYRDSNGNGQVDGEPLLGSASFTGSDATFSQGGGLLSVAAGSPVDLLVVYSFGTSASAGETFALQAVAPGDLSAAGLSSGASVTASGASAAGGLQTFQVGALSLATGPAPPPAASVAVPSSRTAIQQLRLSASGEGARVQSLVFGFAGSGSVAHVQTASLYLDADGDGAVGALDTLLQALPLSGATVTFSQSGGLALVSTSSATDLLLTYDLLASAPAGQTYGADLLSAGEVVATGQITGATLGVSGSAAASNLKTTLASGSLALASGPANPGPQSAAGSQGGVVVQQLSLSASGEGAILDSLRVSRSGSGSDAGVAAVRLYLDANGNGLVDGDTQLAVGTFSSGSVTLGGSNLSVIGAGTTARLLVVYDFAAASAQTYGAGAVSAGDVVARGQVSGAALSPSGSAAAGGLVTINDQPVLSVTSTALGASSVYPTQSRSVALRVQINESAGQAARLRQLSVVASGSANEPSAVFLVRLFRNQAPLASAVGAEDTLIGLTAFFADDGQAAFAGLNELIPASGSLDLLVTYELAGASGSSLGQTLIASLPTGGLSLEPDGGGSALMPTGLPQVGPTLTLGGRLELSLGAQSPSGTRGVSPSQTKAEVLQLDLSVSHFDAAISALAIAASGSGDDATGIAKAELYRDSNGDGLLDGGDTLIQSLSSPFAADNGSAQFSGLSETITAGSSARWLISYDLGASPSAGATFSARVEGTTGLSSNAAVTSGTLPAQGATLRVQGTLSASLGAGAPAAALVPGVQDQAILQVALTAGALEDLSLSSLAVTASGTVSDAAWISAAKLYRDDGDDLFEPGGDDVQLGGAATFSGDDGVATFAGLSQTLTQSSSTKLWVALDLAASPPVAGGASLQLRIASGGVVATGVSSGGALAVSGLPVTGPTRLTSLFGQATTLLATFTTATTRHALAAGDMNRDGKPDLVALGGNSGIEVLLGDGAGGFTSKVERTFTGVGVSRELTLGDFNRDGYLDVAMTTEDALFVVLNQGSADPGNLSGTVTQVFNLGTADLFDVRAADFDRDGDLDLVVGDAGSGRLRHFVNDGSAIFSAGSVLALAGGGVLTGRLALSDLNGDGLLDYVVTRQISGVQVTAAYPGNGAGGAGAATALASGTSPQRLALGAINGDAFPDVVSLDEGGSAYFSFAGGSPILGAGASASTAGISTFTQPRGLVIYDFDRDGSDDLALAHSGVDGVVAHLSSGSLSFPTSAPIDLPAGADADVIVAADFDGDGDGDLVLVSSTLPGQALYYLAGASAPDLVTFSASGGARTPWTSQPERLVTGDFNRDGRLDYAAFSEGGARVGVFLQNASGGFGISFDAALGEDGQDIAVADVDRDGDLDLILVRSGVNDGLRIFKGNGLGGFGAAIDRAVAGSVQDQSALLVVDTNRDGFLDALTASATSGQVQTFRGDGVDFGAGAGGDLTPAAGILSAAGDFNRDGIPDLAAIRSNGSLRTFLGQGDYTFGAGTVLSAAAAVGTPGDLLVGDLDRDGALDLVVVSASAAVFEVFKGDGAGGFTSQGTRTGAAASQGALGDLDRDGDLDLVLAASSGAVVSLRLTVPGSFTFAAPVSLSLTSAQAASGVALGDFDGDGDLDAAVAALNEVELVLGR